MLFPNWSRLMQSGRIRRSRRPLDVSSAEVLERRTVPAVNITGSSAVTILITSNESVSVSDDGANHIRLTVDDGSGAVDTDTSIDARFVQSLTIKATSSSASNTIDLSTMDPSVYLLVSGMTVKGGGGDDLIVGTNLTTVNAVYFGGRGADVLLGGDGNEILNGEDGDDVINGGAGNDTILGGAGTDYLGILVSEDQPSGRTISGTTYNTADDLLAAFAGLASEDGNDNLKGQIGDDNADAGAGDDHLDGSDGNDRLTGGDDNDVIIAGKGDDVIFGDNEDGSGTGNDTISGDFGADLIAAGNGDDSVNGGDGNDIIGGGDGNDTITGGNGNDKIYGGDDTDGSGDGGDDVIAGNAGNDTLLGGDGNDSLLGGAGNDIVAGQAGIDTVNGQGSADTVLGGSGSGEDAGDLVIGLTSEIKEDFALDTGWTALVG